MSAPARARGEARWTTVNELRGELLRLWARGELLRPLVTGETVPPRRLGLKGPGSAELAERFDEVRSWMAELATVPRIRVESREVRHRILGAQQLPQSVWVDTLEDALALIGKRSEGERFSKLVALTRAQDPALLEWMAQRPRQVLDLAEVWSQLLAVVAWLRRHPRPGIYLRQVDLPGIHSKFIEAHRGVLSECLDVALPPEAINHDRTGVGQFAPRYGFLDKPIRIRFRILDPEIVVVKGATQPDVTLDAGSFASLDLPVRKVFITENETNFLAFPPVAQAMVVFGAGYGWDALAQAAWMARCEIHYWGDLDTHGFAILDQLRSRFSHVASFLMDRATLMAHQGLWGMEVDQVIRDLPRLTPSEGALFDDLRDNRIRVGVRLEQEHVDFPWVVTALGALH
jgi:hypothetical protein